MADSVRPRRVSEQLYGALGYLFTRLLFLNSRYAPQVHQGDIAIALADRSTTVAGRTRALRGAAACYHWAEFMYFDDARQKLRLRQGSAT